MDLKQLSEKMSQMQDTIRTIDQKIKAIQVTKEAGAGLVKATVTGEKKVVQLEIDEQLLQKEEKETLQDLVIAAVNLAVDAVEENIKREKQQVSTDFLGPLGQGW